MARDGKELQRLIQAIEVARSRAQGTDIKIQSPQFLPDKVTGKQREHDVVLTITHDHHELLVALECRDRSRPVGIGEIEAFQNKCRDTSIHSAIIVSSKGFYKTARTKGQHYGIRCLTLDEVATFEWFPTRYLNILNRQIIALGLRVQIETFDGRPVVELRDGTGQPVTHDRMVKAAEDALNANAEKLPTGPGPHKVLYRTELNMNVVVDGTSYPADMEIEFQTEETCVPFHFREYRDRDTGAQIMQAAVAISTIGKANVDFVVTKNDDGTLVMSLVPTRAKV